MQETDKHKEERYKRIRRMKKFLRRLPRRSNIHKYPILKWFKGIARKRDYIWSWHKNEMIKAIFIGWIFALIPFYGLQMVGVFIASLIIRANCVIAMALQWITNPITIGPILVAQYLFGDYVFTKFFGFEGVDNSFVDMFNKEDFWVAMQNLATGHNVSYIIATTLFGGFVFAIIGAFITTFFYLSWLNKLTLTQDRHNPQAISKN